MYLVPILDWEEIASMGFVFLKWWDHQCRSLVRDFHGGCREKGGCL